MNRNGFIQAAGAGLFGRNILQPLAKEHIFESFAPGVVKSGAQAETWLVRDETPIIIMLSKAADGVSPISVCKERIPPGKGIAIHKHLNEEEYFYFLSGEGRFHLEPEESAIGAGSVGFVPKNTWHGLQNTGHDPLEFIFGYLPGGFEDFFRKIGTPEGKPFVAKSKPDIVKWAAQYGMVYQ